MKPDYCKDIFETLREINKVRKKLINIIIKNKIIFNEKIEGIKYEKLRFFVSNMSFFYKNTDRDKVINFYKENKDIKEKTLREANLILLGNYVLLGKKIYIENNIFWNKDYKTNYIWNDTFYKNMQLIDLNNDSDVKVPWELSRFQHFFILGKAYWITTDTKYYEEFKKQVKLWIKDNRYGFSVNWTSAMEVSIRAINWIFGYFHFQELIDNDIEFKFILNRSLYMHGEFIFSNLENKGRYRNNHYISNLVGLIFLGIYFKNYKNILMKHKKWIDYGIRNLEYEILYQTNEDGTSFEESTSYHRLVVEFSIYAKIILEKNNFKLSTKYLSRIKTMNEFLLDITKPNMLSPLVGDVDNARLILFGDYYSWEKRNLNYLIGVAGYIFNDNRFKKIGDKYLEENLWLLGISEKNMLKELTQESTAYSDGGYYVIRNKLIYCFFRCGNRNPSYNGVHAHSDSLSIELNILKEDFFVDAGMPTYTSNYVLRNEYRKNSKHNTIILGDYDINMPHYHELFNMNNVTKSICTCYEEDKIEGTHNAYLEEWGVIVTRKVKLYDNYIKINDFLNKKLNHYAYSNFMLHPNVEILERDSEIILSNNGVKIRISGFKEYNIVEDTVSFEYGNYIITKSLKFYFNENIELIIRLEI